eukprot:6076285-Pleurochrysis_carterae.AAC.1
MREALEEAGAGFVTFAQCALGAPTRKYSKVAHSGGALAHLNGLKAAKCTHGEDGHTQVAHGRDATGRARATAAAAYPPQMNVALAEALLAAAGIDHNGDAGEPTGIGATGHGTEEPVDEGRIADGPGLSAFVRA